MTSFSAIVLSTSRAHIFSTPSNTVPHHPSPTRILQPNTLAIRSLNMKRVASSVTTTTKKRRYWLLKTEPSEWSWTDQSTNGGVSNWDGVKNKQAINNIKSMKLGELCFFYHSGNKARCIVGVVEVVKEWYVDEKVGGGVVVDVKEVGEMRRCVDLKEMKRDLGLKGFTLLRQPRLSVVEVSEDIWVKVCEMGDGFAGDGRVEGEDFGVETSKSGE